MPNLRHSETCFLLYPEATRGVAAHDLRATVQSAADENGIKLKVTIEIDALSTLSRLAQEGVGYSILPDYVVKREAELGLVSARKIVNPHIQRTLLLATGNPKMLTPAARVLVELIRREISARTRNKRWIHRQPIGVAEPTAVAGTRGLK